MRRFALERAAVAERAAFHAQNELQAMQAWGPDHASRPPAAVFDMRGPGIKLKSIDLRENACNVGWKVYVCL